MTHRASHYIPRSLERYQRAARKLFVRALYRLWFLSGFCISLWLPPLCVLFPFLHPCLWLPTYLGMLRWHALKQSKLEATSWDQMDRELDYPMLVCLPQPPVDAVVPQYTDWHSCSGTILPRLVWCGQSCLPFRRLAVSTPSSTPFLEVSIQLGPEDLRRAASSRRF